MYDTETLKELCRKGGVRIGQEDSETHPEFIGLWFWVADEGGGSDTSFDTEDEAMQDAVDSLGLDDEG